MSWLSGLIGGASNVLSTGIGAISSAVTAAQNRKWSEEMWNKQNEYNTPTAQMNRLKSAGLNPNLVYGSVSSGNADTPKYQDAYGNTGISQAMSRLSLADAAISAMRGIQELKLKKEETEGQMLANSRSSQEYFARQEELLAQQYFNSPTMVANMADRGFVVQDDGFGNLTYFNPKTSEARSFRLNYLYEKFNNEMMNIIKGINVKENLIKLRNTTNEVYKLQIPYYKTRNKWQPWQYGVGMGSDVIRAVTSLKLPKVSLSPVPANKSYNNTYNYF